MYQSALATTDGFFVRGYPCRGRLPLARRWRVDRAIPGYACPLTELGCAIQIRLCLIGAFSPGECWYGRQESHVDGVPVCCCHFPTPLSLNSRVSLARFTWQTSDDQGAHISFVVHVEVEATQEAWDAPRRYREFTQLRKRLLRLGIDIPTAAAARSGGSLGTLAPDLPKKTWRSNKFDKDHLMTRRVALEAYLQAAVQVRAARVAILVARACWMEGGGVLPAEYCVRCARLARVMLFGCESQVFRL